MNYCFNLSFALSKCQTFSVIFSSSPHCSGTIYGFNVTANKSVQQMAAKNGIPLRLHRVIYKLIDQLKDDLSSKLPPTTEENIIGKCIVNILLILNSIKGWFFSFTSHASLTTRPRYNIYRHMQIETNIAQCVKWSITVLQVEISRGPTDESLTQIKLVRCKWKNEVALERCVFSLTLQGRLRFWPCLMWRLGKRGSQWLDVEFRRASWTKRWNSDLFEGEIFSGKVNLCQLAVLNTCYYNVFCFSCICLLLQDPWQHWNIWRMMFWL